MRLIKESVKFTGNDISIKVPITVQENLNGQQDAIDSFIEEKTGLSVNESKDGEKFKYLPDNPTTFNFHFYDGNNHANVLTRTSITSANISDKDESVLRSFYVMQVFDSFNLNNQNLLHSSYFNGFTWINNGTSSRYSVLGEDIEYTNLYLPNYHFSDITATTTELYVRFYFYNAKDGKLFVFYNHDNRNLLTDEKLFFKINIKIGTKKYDWDGLASLTIRETKNSDYSDVVNESLDSFNNEKPVYPSGGGLFGSDGKYIEII